MMKKMMKMIKKGFKWYFKNYSRLCMTTGGYYWNPNN